MKSFDGKVAVITGAGSGIGRALALELARRGAQLALSDIGFDAVSATADACRVLGGKASAFALDVSDRAAVEAHAGEVSAQFGGTDLVINNAGVALGSDVVDMSWDDFEWLMSINFWGVTYGTKAFLPALIASGDSHLVNISSVFGLMSVPGQSAYNAAKFAVRGFTEALRQEMRIAGHHVGVTCVHPGGIKTDIVRSARGMDHLGDPDTRSRDFQRWALTSPEKAAEVILAGVQKNKPRVLIGPDARGFDMVPRVVGPRYQDIASTATRLGRKVTRR